MERQAAIASSRALDEATLLRAVQAVLEGIRMLVEQAELEDSTMTPHGLLVGQAEQAVTSVTSAQLVQAELEQPSGRQVPAEAVPVVAEAVAEEVVAELVRMVTVEQAGLDLKVEIIVILEQVVVDSVPVVVVDQVAQMVAQAQLERVTAAVELLAAS
jgi:hypothetical protein